MSWGNDLLAQVRPPGQGTLPELVANLEDRQHARTVERSRGRDEPLRDVVVRGNDREQDFRIEGLAACQCGGKRLPDFPDRVGGERHHRAAHRGAIGRRGRRLPKECSKLQRQLQALFRCAMLDHGIEHRRVERP
jgi:hypothetical protein